MNHEKNRSLSNYYVVPRTVMVGKESTVTVYPIGAKPFLEGVAYFARFIPMECHLQSWIDTPKFDTAPAVLENGALTFSYTFDEEQEWSIEIGTEQELANGKPTLTARVYSLFDDLYYRNPYMGDLHVHSNESDGRERPIIVAANYRKEGFDFFALTDHGKWESSDKMCQAFENIPLGIKLFRGEEVHVPGGWIHIVNFGGDISVNKLFHENEKEISEKIAEEAKLLDTPKGVYALDYAYRKWIAAEIRRGGGLCIVPHPYWIFRNSYNMSDRMLRYVFENGDYDAFELIGGQSLHENNVQISFYNQLRSEGIKIPIVGSSDSHGTDPASYFCIGKTVVFAPDMERDSIINSIKDEYSVAIEQQYGEGERVYGSYRLVKYTRFLLNYYFPAHDELCVEEGILMREYALGSKTAGEALRPLCDRTARLMRKLLRGEE